MNAVCPACGVAVVPGYVRCPKCRAALPYGNGRTKRGTADPGGTSLEDKGRFPFAAVIAGVLVTAAIVLFFGLRGGSKPTHAAPIPAEPIVAQPIPATPTPVVRGARPVAPQPQQTEAPSVSPDAVAAELVDHLRHQRLWSTAEVRGGQIDIRSGSCGEPGMRPIIDTAQPAMRDAGLTKLRCLAQSGAVVFERDL